MLQKACRSKYQQVKTNTTPTTVTTGAAVPATAATNGKITATADATNTL